jgi:hypothetical protein
VLAKLGAVRKDIVMDKESWLRIQKVVGPRALVNPEPKEGENVQFLEVSFDKERPADVLNRLGKAGLIGVDAKIPHLELVGQIYNNNPQDLIHYLTFEDLSHPNSSR